ncbi:MULTISPECIES: diacylglycerol/lipid kinase family protein [unclassified Parvimonas]|jgi:lipid kinase, YegS/Rv2252/BmrU family|uniref:diacylglycerol/lipid kinase family protein n=1 Tax=unclassified Parvimonas TaxID=1151464 RepID=UPI002B474E91|nr:MULTISPECIES: YegS/Rv2252/BmrU family lipid kinase [unclassified Parvimonas]MEB3025344.1 YegS/Rv2252/BmrU family lipid kinase [Parvimonas sp. M13]MEB3089480.1 YegS/Rv2252/BmrU family lipid kinase [Parvimonas sp. M20]
MRKLMFILNPNASGFKKFDFKEGIENYLKNKNLDFEYEIKCSTKEGESILIAENAVKDGFNELIAVGGDGTINEVGDVAIKNNLKLGVIPAGTGNDYMNSLNESCNFVICMERIIRGSTILVDYGSFLDKSFFNIASVGFDAEVNEYAVKVKKIIKSGFAYKIAIALALFHHKRKRYKLIIDDVEYEDDYFLIAIGIGSKYGGKINILPYADMQDGLLDICAIRYKSKFDIIKKIKTIVNATHVNEDITSCFKAKKIKVISKNVEINFDGEYMSGVDDVEFIVNDKKVELIM